MGAVGDVVPTPVGRAVVTAIHDAARQAALDERDRLGAAVSDYVCGRICEAVLAVIERRPLEDAPDPIDIDCKDVTDA